MLDALLDRTIAWRFDASGFVRHARRFRPGALDVDLSGRNYVVTGANSGLGYATTAALARRGARVWMACRSAARAEEAAERIRADGGAPPHVALLDVSDLASVRAFAAEAPASIDGLVHNAGLLNDRRVLTADGLEETFAVHVAGPQLLTRLLADRCARVVWVSSGGMYTQRLDVERLQRPPEPFDGVVAYARCKRAQVVLAAEWHARLAARGAVVSAMHPGWAATPGVASSLPRFDRLLQGRLRSAAQGADTIVWLAASPDASEAGRRFWFDRAEAPEHLLPWTRETPTERAHLWDAVEAAVG